MGIKRFEELEVWQISRELVREVYKLTENPEFSKDFGLKDQVKRSAVSIMSNIAEGFERKTNKEFIRFLFTAKGSCGELKSQLYIALDLDYITKEEFKKYFAQVEKISKSLGGFIKYLKSSILNLKSLILNLQSGHMPVITKGFSVESPWSS